MGAPRASAKPNAFPGKITRTSNSVLKLSKNRDADKKNAFFLHKAIQLMELTRTVGN
jgi:hypothetical protein